MFLVDFLVEVRSQELAGFVNLQDQTSNCFESAEFCAILSSVKVNHKLYLNSVYTWDLWQWSDWLLSVMKPDVGRLSSCYFEARNMKMDGPFYSKIRRLFVPPGQIWLGQYERHCQQQRTAFINIVERIPLVLKMLGSNRFKCHTSMRQLNSRLWIVEF
jgi:hypothetical protein